MIENLTAERGEFWLSPNAEGEITADSSTKGALTIEDDGMATLKLDLEDWKWGESLETVSALIARRFDIVGYLPRLNRYVRMERASVKRPQLALSRGWAAEILSATSCLLSCALVPGYEPQECVSVLRTPLTRHWPWLGRPVAEGHGGPENYTVQYPPDLQQEFRIKSGRLTIETETSLTRDLKQRRTILSQRAWIRIDFDNPIKIDEAARLFLDLEDLMVLLTDQESGFDWPSAQTVGVEEAGALYCSRRRGRGAEVSFFDCWVPFPQIDNFGSIVENWIAMRGVYGAAFHLYLGTRRGMSLYVEHRFVNLIWGLEALHRHGTEIERKPRLAVEVAAKVIELVGRHLNAKNRKTLKEILNQTFEPDLALRLKEMFRDLPIEFSGSSLHHFTEQCRTLRNDISHRGGPRPGVEYEKFMLEIHHLSGALAHLYHAVILQRIGISDEQIRHVFLGGFKSSQISARLGQAKLGLIKP